MMTLGRWAWTLQVIAIYLLAEFAIFTISGRLLILITGSPTPGPMNIIFIFLPLTLSAFWMLRVLFGPHQWGPPRQ